MKRLIARVAVQLRRYRWGALGTGLAALVAALVPAAQIRGGAATLNGLIGSYMYQVDIPVGASVSDLRVADAYYPLAARIEWSAGVPGAGAQRWQGNTVAPIDATYCGPGYAVDTAPALQARYQYAVARRGYESDPDLHLPFPPADLADDMLSQVYYRYVQAGYTWQNVDSALYQTDVSANQTADSRLDMRYAVDTLLDFRFRGGIYKGGLFVGYAVDPSRVSRSYFGFRMQPTPFDATLWTSTLNAYTPEHLGSLDVGQISCQGVSGAWDPNTLCWSAAPTLDPSAAAATSGHFSDDHWARWTAAAPVSSGMAGSGAVSLGLASKQESTNGWYYFAKKEYDAALGARLMSAWQDKLGISSLTVSPFAPNGETTGAVVLNAPAPTGGCRVALFCDGCWYVSLPETIYIPAGQDRASFNLTFAGGNCVGRPFRTYYGTTFVGAALNNSVQEVQVTFAQPYYSP